MIIADSIPKNAECQSFTSTDLQNMTRPCVYIFLRDGVPLYIGSSANGLIRAGWGTHHKEHVREMADEVQVIWCRTTWRARALEGRLIVELNPKFNGRIVKGKHRRRG